MGLNVWIDFEWKLFIVIRLCLLGFLRSGLLLCLVIISLFPCLQGTQFVFRNYNVLLVPKF
jgi:hypothetical protein